MEDCGFSSNLSGLSMATKVFGSLVHIHALLEGIPIIVKQKHTTLHEMSVHFHMHYTHKLISNTLHNQVTSHQIYIHYITFYISQSSYKHLMYIKGKDRQWQWHEHNATQLNISYIYLKKCVSVQKWVLLECYQSKLIQNGVGTPINT